MPKDVLSSLIDRVGTPPAQPVGVTEPDEGEQHIDLGVIDHDRRLSGHRALRDVREPSGTRLTPTRVYLPTTSFVIGGQPELFQPKGRPSWTGRADTTAATP